MSWKFINKMPYQISSSPYWTPQNFLTTNSAADNVTALNDALTNHRSVYIPAPAIAGTPYEIDGTIWIPSNTKLEFAPGCTLKKTGTAYVHMIANKGMQTGTRNTNIKLYGNGLIFDVNGNESAPLGQRGQLNFFRVDNFVVDDIKTDSDASQQFFFPMTDCTFGKISNIDIRQIKDGIDLIYCRDMSFTNIKIYTWDDSFFIGIGYAIATVVLGTSERITVDGYECGGYDATPQGNAIRLYSGSWSDWVSGNTYGYNESCINAGNIYSKSNNNNIVSTAAPVHTSGAVTGADGITWYYIQPAGITEAGVKDITITNVTLNSNKRFLDLANICATGTGVRNLIDNVVIDNATIPVDFAGTFFVLRGSVGTLNFKNSDITAPTGYFMLWAVNDAGLKNAISLSHLILDNVNINTPVGRLYTLDSTIIFDKITTTDCEILVTPTGNVPDFTIAPLCLDNLNAINCTRTVFHNPYAIIKPIVANAAPTTIRLTDCVIDGTCVLVAVVTQAGNHINYISSGTAYVDPTTNLFYNNQVNGDLTIDVTNSSGVITAAKVRNGTKVTVINCDIPYV